VESGGEEVEEAEKEKEDPTQQDALWEPYIFNEGSFAAATHLGEGAPIFRCVCTPLLDPHTHQNATCTPRGRSSAAWPRNRGSLVLPVSNSRQHVCAQGVARRD
jgi:hypothetical protein